MVPTYPLALLLDRTYHVARLYLSKACINITLSCCIDAILELHVEEGLSNCNGKRVIFSVIFATMIYTPSKYLETRKDLFYMSLGKGIDTTVQSN